MKKTLVLILALSLAASSCGDDDTAVSSEQLTAAERDWCSVSDRSDESATRFDEIFEAGLELRLNMDQLNATAARLFDEYQAGGLSEDEAVRAVSDDLFRMPDFAAACKRAFAQSEAG